MVPQCVSTVTEIDKLGAELKTISRRELLFEVFTKDTLKSVFGAYREFTNAQGEVKKFVSCDDAACMLGGKNKESSNKFFDKVRKEG